MENKIEKAMKPIPVPYQEFAFFPKHVEEFFDLIARCPFELLETRPRREFEDLFKTEPELMSPMYLKLYETEEALVARAAVPGHHRQKRMPGRSQPLAPRPPPTESSLTGPEAVCAQAGRLPRVR